MKPLRIVLAPTRNRPLNIFLGLVLVLVCAARPARAGHLSCHRPLVEHRLWRCRAKRRAQLDRPLRRIAQRPAAAISRSDRLLPASVAERPGMDLDAFPSRRPGLAALDGRRAGSGLYACRSGAFALALLWQGRPVAGVAGLLMADLLVRYLNFQGAMLVAGVLAAAGICFASAVFFSAIAETHPGALAQSCLPARPLAQLARAARGSEGSAPRRARSPA